MTRTARKTERESSAKRSQRPARGARRELDEFYAALSALAREYQFRDRESEAYAGLSVTECYVLEVLAEGETLSVSAIGRELRLDKSTASRAISRLEESGLVRRLDDPNEHRAWRVMLTTKGHAAVARATGRVKEQLRAVLGELSATARRTVIAVLRDLSRLTRDRLRGR